jgi:hypothetical protein
VCFSDEGFERLVTMRALYHFTIFHYILEATGARGTVVVKALCYKPEGRGFDTR